MAILENQRAGEVKNIGYELHACAGQKFTSENFDQTKRHRWRFWLFARFDLYTGIILVNFMNIKVWS